MRTQHYQPRLHWFAIGVAVMTLLLIGLGGLVTSHGAGMAVPDWPTTYGYNMFFFPVSLWTGGIFYEHSHRLLASAVGLLTLILAVWLWLRDDRPWLRGLGMAAVGLVVGQGVLGGLRVTERINELGIVHATLAQLFLVLTSAIALFTSRRWREHQPPVDTADPRRLAQLRALFAVTTALILLQLILGAAMRHQHAGLAVPDFPLAYGQLWPDLSPEAIAAYNQGRTEWVALDPITPAHVILHMAHRLMALLILVGIILSVRWTRRHARRLPGLPGGSAAWLGLALVQVGLGAATVWTNKSADIATLHVLAGASLLVIGALLWIDTGRSGLRNAAPTPGTQPAPHVDRPPHTRHAPA